MEQLKHDQSLPSDQNQSTPQETCIYIYIYIAYSKFEVINTENRRVPSSDCWNSRIKVTPLLIELLRMVLLGFAGEMSPVTAPGWNIEILGSKMGGKFTGRAAKRSGERA